MWKSLQLRVPPLAVLLFWVVMMRLLHRADSGSLDFHRRGQAWLAGLILAGGVAITLSGVVSFRAAHTTVDPLHPDKAARLVTNGIYRYTRNPMYLGMTLTLLAWGVHLGSLLALLFMPLFMVYLTRYQIVPEERTLMQKFGGAFQRYRKRVRRWL